VPRKRFAIVFLFVCLGRLLQIVSYSCECVFMCLCVRDCVCTSVNALTSWHNITPKIFQTHMSCYNNVFIVSCNNPHVSRGTIGNLIRRRQCSLNIQSSSLCVGPSDDVHKLSRVHGPVGGRHASGWLLR